MAKYNNKKVEFDGIMFDSIMEKNYYQYLLTKIPKKDIIIQPVFELQPKYIKRNQNIRPITYIADFQR